MKQSTKDNLPGTENNFKGKKVLSLKVPIKPPPPQHIFREIEKEEG